MEENNKTNKTLKIILIVLCVIAFFVGLYFGYNFVDKQNKDKIDNKQQEVVKEKITPVLYEVTKEGSDNKMYLFGSIHATKREDLNFPDYVLNAYNNSHYLACEFDMVAYAADQDKVFDDVMKMAYDDGTTIEDHMSSEAYTKMVNFLTEKNTYNKLYDVYKPVFFQSLLTNAMISDSELSATDGIDNYFLKKAKEDNKTILEVETSDFQNDLLASFPDSFYELAIIDTIDNYDESIESLKSLYEAWKKGNVEDLIKYSDDDMDVKEGYTKEQIALVKDYNKKLIDDRNKTMTEKAIEYFNNNQDVFYMVGTLHIVGDTGLAKQLEQKGYTVKQINN